MHSRISSCRKNIARVVNLYQRFILLFLIAATCYPALAQESYLVSTQDGVVSMYDLATNSFVASTKLSGDSFNMVPAANPRLAFVSVLSSYYSVVDTMLNREVSRHQGGPSFPGNRANSHSCSGARIFLCRGLSGGG